jgi:pilus assembly protein Flp/PilA
MLKRFLRNYMTDESGATALEYAVLVGVFSVGLLAVWSTAGDDILPNFATIAENLHTDSAAETPLIE